jgi:phospholipase/lecithinase/hemolysin
MKGLFSVFALVFSGLVAAHVLHEPLQTIIAFGDSLIDNGNSYEHLEHRAPPSPPYYAGRFTNGPVWVEHLAESYFPAAGAAHLLDYAFGGAEVSEEDGVLFTLNREIQIYLDAHQGKADPHSLFVVWIGANNYLSVPDNMEEALLEVKAGIQRGLQRLVSAGAKYILVVNLPDLGQTPMAREFDAQAKLTYLSEQHNKYLAEMAQELRSTYQEVQWLYFDAHEILSDFFTNPEAYGFNNIMDTCYNVSAEKPSQQPALPMTARARLENRQNRCEGYLFFDPVHPTLPAHLIMAERARRFLDAEGVQFTN